MRLFVSAIVSHRPRVEPVTMPLPIGVRCAEYLPQTHPTRVPDVVELPAPLLIRTHGADATGTVG